MYFSFFYCHSLVILLLLYLIEEDSCYILILTQMTQKLRFKRGNLVGDGHPTPAIAEVLVSVMCRLPSSIVLIADEPGIVCFYLSCVDSIR